MNTKPIGSDEEVVAKLDEIYKSDQTRSKIGRLRVIYDEIKRKREGGTHLSVILKGLNDEGFNMSLKTLTNYLQTIKNERLAEKEYIDTPTETPKPRKAVKKKKQVARIEEAKKIPEITNETPGTGSTVEKKAAAIAVADKYTSGSGDNLINNILKGK